MSLFLLICDLAINPTRGIPFDFGSIEDFIIDIDPGARFVRLCGSARSQPHLTKAIQHRSDEEYWDVARALTSPCGYDDPRVALEEITSWPDRDPAVAQLMREQATFEYRLANQPIRVMVSHFIAFSMDKLAHPAFFCWPGAALAGERTTEQTQALFLRHLSLFSDRADTEQIFVRDFPGKTDGAAKSMLDRFYSSLVMYELALQWILEEGPFRYEFESFTGRRKNPEMEAWAKRQFVAFFGVSPEDFVFDPA